MGLNSKQAKFARLVASGEMTDQEAYLQVWKRGRMQDATFRAMVSNKKNHPGISAEIELLKAQFAEKAAITMESLIEELEEARGIAKIDINPAAMVSATMGKAKLTGLDKTIVEIKGAENLTPWDTIVAGVAVATAKDAT